MTTTEPIRTLAHASTAGIDVVELQYAAGLRIPRHAHERAGFCLVLGGEYVEGYSSRNLTCRAQTVTFSPAGEEHRNVFDRGSAAHCLTIDVPRQLVERLDAPALRTPFEQHRGELSSLAQRLFHEVRAADAASSLAIEGLVLEMVAAASRSEDRVEHHVPPAIRRVRELLEARFAEMLPINDLAAAVDRHPVYVATAFRRAYGETIGAYVRRLRVAHVRQELQSTRRPIADIALGAGFASQSHMTRTFRRITGTTPAAYRMLNGDHRAISA